MTAGRRCYLDNNATTPLWSQVAAAMADALAEFGNPSSVHAEGRAARRMIETARAQVAELVGADARDVVFTSGGTEAASTLLAPPIPGSRLFVMATEHACVLAGGRFDRADVLRLPVLPDGRLDVAAARAGLANERERAPVIAVQHANNETGVVQDIARLRAALDVPDAIWIVDAVQSVGKLPVAVAALGADAIFVSAHKVGGPKGVGAIVYRDEGARVRASGRPLIGGGGQERGHRGGTENVAGIVGFGMAAAAAREALPGMASVARLRDEAEARIRAAAPDALIFGDGSSRLPNTSLFAVPGFRAETALIAFDLAGVALSSGAACSSGKVHRSHVLAAMGVPSDIAEGAVRLSLWHDTQPADIERFSIALGNIVCRRRRRQAA